MPLSIGLPLLASFNQPITLGQFVLFLLTAVVGFIVFLLLINKYKPAPSNPDECPWYLRWFSWGKRHVPLLLGIVAFFLLLFAPVILKHLTFWAYDAHPILPNQDNLDSDQENAIHQASGSKSIGTIVGIFSGGTLLFSGILVVVWFILHYIVPGGPIWAKKYYTLGFKNPSDEGYVEEFTLTTANKHTNWNKVWLTLLWIYAFCIYIVAVTP
jgi:hypothetical protein